MTVDVVLTHFHMCCGLGGGGKGFNRNKKEIAGYRATWECLGGVDVMPAAVRDFERMTGVPGTLLDLMSRDQYVRFHGVEPPPGWREATPEDLRKAAKNRRPDVVFISAPCQGASGLLSESKAATVKYQALNELTLRCIWLMAEAGKDWRSLERFAVEDGYLRDFAIVPEGRHGFLGVNAWEGSTGVVQARSGPTNGKFSVADPRYASSAKWNYGQNYGVVAWDGSTGTVTGQASPGQGAFAVQDPRGRSFSGKYAVVPFDGVAGTVLAGSTTGQGAFALADPRVLGRTKGDAYLTGGHYGVVGFDESSGAVSASACHDNGRWSVADPRLPELNDRLTCMIRALDGTWHRPFTTLELAVLQSLADPEEFLELEGLNDSAWRERIGNAVPPAAAEAIADVMATTLLLNMAGETFSLSSTPLWVRNVAMALSINQPLELAL